MDKARQVSLPRLLTPAEAAEALNVSRSLVYQLVETGKLPCHRIGKGRGAIRLSEHDLLDFLSENRVSKQSGEAKRPPRRKLRHLKT